MATKEKFRPLPDEYTNGGYTYKQQKRGKKGVIYLAKGKRHDEKEYAIAEVFVIKVAKAVDTKVKGKRVVAPEREKIPGNSDFGAWAWCISGKTVKQTIERAEKIFKEIEDGIRPEPQPVTDDEAFIKV